MLDISVKDIILNTKSNVSELLYKIISEYEKTLNLTEDYSIKKYMDLNLLYLKDNPQWILEAYSKTVDYDINLTTAIIYSVMLSNKHINFKEHNYLNFSKQSFLNLFQTLKTLDTLELVDNTTLIQLAKRTDNLLHHDILEYKVIRLICVSKVLGLYNVTCTVSNLILTQEQILI